jgi:hypothetical protein
MEVKIEKRNFGVAEFEEEEKWLEEQHRSGWSLIKTNGNKYEFKKCDADEWNYQLDFKENGVAEEDYIQMFEDCSWEFVLQYDKWCCFRKKQEDGADLSIFSDKFSRIDMYTRILKSRHLRVVVVLFAIACVIEFLTIFTNFFKGNSGIYWVDFWKAALPWIGAGLYIASFYSFEQYRKLKNMAKELKSPE